MIHFAFFFLMSELVGKKDLRSCLYVVDSTIHIKKYQYAYYYYINNNLQVQHQTFNLLLIKRLDMNLGVIDS